MKFYTNEMDEFIKEKYELYEANVFVRIFNSYFDDNRTTGALEKRAMDLGIRKNNNSNTEFKLNIDDIKRRTIDKEVINGYELVKFYPNYALFEKKYKTGDVARTTYTYWDLDKIV